MTHKKPSAAQLRALRAFAHRHGRTWKSVLRAQWAKASAPPELMQLRNSLGPSWLASFKMPASRVVHRLPKKGRTSMSMGRPSPRRVLSDRSKYPKSSALSPFAAQYIDTALWSSTDNSDDSGGEPLDRNYSVDDIAPATLNRMKRDADAFLRAHSDDIGYGRSNTEQAAHDLWLSRNGHGTGFWDHEHVYGVPEANRLDGAAKALGEFDLYVGSDGMIHGSGTQHTTRTARSRRRAIRRSRA